MSDIVAEYTRRTEDTVAPATVFRDLKAMDFVSVVRPRVVNNDPVKNKARFVFAKKVKREVILGKDVIFSDECWINDNDNTNRREWRRAGAAASARKFQKRASVKVMVWGAIGHNYKSELQIIQGTVTAASYIKDTLPGVQATMRRFRKRYFMQDGAKPHTAKATKAWFSDRGIKLMDWPAHSPHLNPIEKLWAIFHKRIAKAKPKSTEDLIAKAKMIWDSFSMKEINKIVGNFDSGIKRSIEEKGRPW